MIGQITVYVGCMKSSKTEMLIQKYHEALVRGTRVIAYKPVVDTRGEKQFIHSRQMGDIPASPLDAYGANIIADMEQQPDGTSTLYLIDEAQFLSDVAWLIDGIKKGNDFIICALTNDHQGHAWAVTSQIISMADNIVHLHAYCDFCKTPANFNLLVKKKSTMACGQVAIESPDNIYYAVCRKCWLEKK